MKDSEWVVEFSDFVNNPSFYLVKAKESKEILVVIFNGEPSGVVVRAIGKVSDLYQDWHYLVDVDACNDEF